MNKIGSIIKLVLIALLATRAHAVVNITFTENVGSVFATFEGSLNLNDLTSLSTNVAVSSLGGSQVYANPFFLGIGGSSHFDPYGTIIGPTSVGSGTTSIIASSSTGDFIGIGNGIGPGSNPTDVGVPTGYVSGASISGSSTWVGHSFSSLGIDVGSYTWSWGSGLNADSVTIDVVPEPSAALFVGLVVVVMLWQQLRTRVIS